MKRPLSLINYYSTCSVDWDTFDSSQSISKERCKSFVDVKQALFQGTNGRINHITKLSIILRDPSYVIKTKVYDRYPDESYDDLDLDFSGLGVFCFPTGASIKVVEKINANKGREPSKLHHFVMTDEYGKRVNGSCINFFDKIEQSRFETLSPASLFQILELDKEQSTIRTQFKNFLKAEFNEDKHLFYYIFELSCILLNETSVTDKELFESLKKKGFFESGLFLKVCEIMNLSVVHEENYELIAALDLYLNIWKILELRLPAFVSPMYSEIEFVLVEKAICLISPLEHFQLYGSILKEILSLSRIQKGPSIPLQNIICHVVSDVPEPPPGKLKLAFKLYDEHPIIFSCSKPAINKLPLLDLRLKLLFEKLSCQNLLTAFSALTLEKRVIIAGKNLDEVSQICLGLSKLLFPLKWEAPFLPTLSKNMLDVVEAPFPYLVGIHSSLVREDNFLSASCVFVDIDINLVEVSYGYEIAQPPPIALSKLVKGLKRQVYGDKLQPLSLQKGAMKHFGPLYLLSDDQFNDGVREIFLVFFIDLLKDYKKFLGGMEVEESELFERRKFVRNHSETGVASEYLDMFAGSQMIQMFCEERLFLPERNFEVMFFDAWIAKSYKTNSLDYNINFLEDSSQEIVTEYYVEPPVSSNKNKTVYPDEYPLNLDWSSIPKALPIDRLHKLRRGSHLLKNVKKVSLVLEAVYLSFYTKRTVLGAKFKLVMMQVSSGVEELTDILGFLKEVCVAFKNFLGRIKHSNAEEFKDSSGNLTDADEFMSTKFWPSYLRSEKAWVSLLEAYIFALQENVVVFLEEMLRKLTNQKKLLKINGKRWFSKVETTKTEVEDLKRLTEKSEAYVEKCKKDLEEFNEQNIQRGKIFECNNIAYFSQGHQRKKLQRKLVYAIVFAEKCRLDFAEKVAFLNRELVKFSESLSDIFRDFSKNEQRRLNKLQQSLETVVSLSFDFFHNLHKTIGDNLGQVVNTFIASKCLEKSFDDYEGRTRDDFVEIKFRANLLEKVIYLPKFNERYDFRYYLEGERVELHKHEAYLNLLSSNTVLSTKQVSMSGNTLMPTKIETEVTYESSFLKWKEHIKQVRRIYKLVVERAEIKAQAYGSLGSALLLLAPDKNGDIEVNARTTFPIPSFFKRNDSAPPEEARRSSLSQPLSRESSFMKAITELRSAFCLFGKLLLEKGVQTVENDIVFLSQQIISLLRDILRREQSIKSAKKRQLQSTQRLSDKAKSAFEKEQTAFNHLLDEYNNYCTEKRLSVSTSPSKSFSKSFSKSTTNGVNVEAEVEAVLYSLISDVVRSESKDRVKFVKKKSIKGRVSLPPVLDSSLRTDKRLQKLSSRVSSFTKDIEKSRSFFEECIEEVNMTQAEYLTEIQRCFYIFEIEESLRILCTVRSFSSTFQTNSSIFESLKHEFERVKLLVLNIDPSVDLIVNRRLNSRLEKFSRSALKALNNRRSTQDLSDIDEMKKGSSDFEENNISFGEGTLGSCDLSSCGDDAKQISFAACMMNYFPTILLYFNEFKSRLSNLEDMFKECRKINLISKSYLKKTLKKTSVSHKTRSVGDSFSLFTLYSNLIKVVTAENKIFEKQETAFKSLETKTWMLNKEMMKVVAVHAARKDRLDLMLETSEKEVETKTTTYLTLEHKLDELERGVPVSSRKAFPCFKIEAGMKKTPQKKIFQLRNLKEAEFREMCNAEKELHLRKGTFDDCLAQILHRLQGHLEKYLSDLLSILSRLLRTLSQSQNIDESNMSLTTISLLTSNLLKLQEVAQVKSDEVNDLEELESSDLLTKYEDIVEDLEYRCHISKEIQLLLSKRLTLFNDRRKALIETIEKVINNTNSVFSFMTVESSSTVRCMNTLFKSFISILNSKFQLTKRVTVESLKTLKQLNLFARNELESFRNNTSKTMSHLKKALKDYNSKKDYLAHGKSQLQKDRSFTVKKSKALKRKVSKYLSKFHKSQHTLLDLETKSKSEMKLVVSRYSELVKKEKYEILKLSELSLILEEETNKNVSNELSKSLQSYHEVEAERDVTVFIEWHGKPLSSATSSFSQRFSFHSFGHHN